MATDWILLDITNVLNPTLRLGPMGHTGTVKWAFLNKRVQFHLKPASTLVVETKVLTPICCVP
jgi:hypothetical protein